MWGVHYGPMMNILLQVLFLAPGWPLSCAHNLQCYHCACCPLAQDLLSVLRCFHHGVGVHMRSRWLHEHSGGLLQTRNNDGSQGPFLKDLLLPATHNHTTMICEVRRTAACMHVCMYVFWMIANQVEQTCCKAFESASRDVHYCVCTCFVCV